MSGPVLPHTLGTGSGASEHRRGSAARSLANAMTLPACVGVVAPVVVLGLVILVSGLAYQDLVHAVFVAPYGVLVALASTLFLGLWVHRRLGTAVVAGADRATVLRTAGLLTIRVVALCLVIWAVGMALFLIYPGHDPLRAVNLLEQAIWVLVSGTGLLWTGILAGSVSQRWGWPRTALVGIVCWALLIELPDSGAWVLLHPWLDGGLHALDGLALTLLAVALAVREVKRWEPAD